MQMPFLDATKGNPEISEKPEAGIWIADDFAFPIADGNVRCVASSSHKL
jgi:hypothetical protein